MLGNSSQGLLLLCEDERTKRLSSPRRIPPGLGSKASRVPPAPDGARAASRPSGQGRWFPHRLQVDNQRIVDSLICSPLTRCPSSTQLLIHAFAHSPLTPSDSHGTSGTSWAPSSDPFISPTSYSGYHRDERSAQISTSLAWVPPGSTSPRAWPHLPAQSFPFSVVGSHKDPRGTHTCASNKGRSISAQEATFGQWNTEATG